MVRLQCAAHTWLSVVGTVLSVPITDVSIELFSRTVSRKVSSPLQSLTSVFGMGTGGPSAFVTLTLIQLPIGH